MSEPAAGGIVDLETLGKRLGPLARLAGLDLGTRTIGVALSSPALGLASPLRTLPRKKFGDDADALSRIVEEHGIRGFVIGLPINMNGTEGPRAQSARAFARNLARRLPLPFAFWDERLSTVEAERLMIAADASRAKRREAIDAVAASLILQGALDRLAAIERRSSSA